GKYGLQDISRDFDTASVFEHVRKTRQYVYNEADQPAIYEKMGITVEFGYAHFNDNHSLTIEGNGTSRTVSSKYIIIAAGSRAIIPPVKGLDDVGYLTNETIFELNKIPHRLIIIGGGPVGTEMSQAFCRLGSKVVVIDKNPHILAKDDFSLTEILKENLEKEGIRFLMKTDVHDISETNGTIRLHVTTGGINDTVEGDALLVAAGRGPRLDRLNLNAANVKTYSRGIEVDKHGRTSAKNIYACGDVTGKFQLTHMSEHTAKTAAVHALLKLPYRIDEKHIVWATYTDPELAHVGATRGQLDRNEVSYKRYRFPYNKIDRAIAENEVTGWIHIYAGERSGKILGVDILGERAGDMISEYALAMKNGISLRKIADTIHPYPTYGLGVRRAADQWYVQRQSVGLIRVVQKLFGYRGLLPDLSDKERIV
ncbi:MAG TPA: FAD-dependent oxidoreductase, partial [Balneolales bacterium]|nr:FAD-dependent oxidoreductase [Balneolales bacterium]